MPLIIDGATIQNMTFQPSSNVNITGGNISVNNSIITTGAINSQIILVTTLGNAGNIGLTMAYSGQALTTNTANLSTITVPTGLSIGFRCLVTQLGTGNTKFVANAGVTMHSKNGANNTVTGQYGSMSLFCYETNKFVVDGASN